MPLEGWGYICPFCSILIFVSLSNSEDDGNLNAFLIENENLFSFEATGEVRQGTAGAMLTVWFKTPGFGIRPTWV